MKRDEAYLRAIVREIDYLPSELKGYNLQTFIKGDKNDCSQRNFRWQKY